MITLKEAWVWYLETRKLLRLMRRFASHYWDQLPWADALEKDELFRTQEGPPLVDSAGSSLDQLDDLAIVVLFSAFESQVRSRVLLDVEDEIKQLKHPALQSAGKNVEHELSRGSFHRVLSALSPIDHDLVEQVWQVRHYRN
ncbi:hypothetical protein SAMN05444166_2217 [Singulisphaera sp. GP187]|nr:hypothetical protein SAMN05444166_2217 [Singulisphaera sp. GP187]